MAILAFHNVSPGLLHGLNNYTPDRFLALLTALENAGNSILPLCDYLKERSAGAVSLTFDDGYESFYHWAFPILRQRNISATVFIPTGFIGEINRWDYASFLSPNRHLNTDQIKELAQAGIEIGSHGYSHESLQFRGHRRLFMELSRSKELLETIAGRRINYISYPFGRFDNLVEKISMECGYERGLSMTYFGRSPTGFTLPRYSIYAFDTPLAVTRKIEGGIGGGIEKVKGAIMNAYAGGTILWQGLFGSKKTIS